MITKIWDEFELRYTGLTRKAIEVSMPYIRNFDSNKMRLRLFEAIEEAGKSWPPFIVEWHKQHLRIKTTAAKSIENIMCNVNHLIIGSMMVALHVNARRCTKDSERRDLPELYPR